MGFQREHEQRWVSFEDVATARVVIRARAMGRIPGAVLRALAVSASVVLGLVLIFGVWLQPAQFPAQLLEWSTVGMVLFLFTTPWPLVLVFGDYHDQRALLGHITWRLQSGEQIPMPAQGVLAVPILINEDQGR